MGRQNQTHFQDEQIEHTMLASDCCITDAFCVLFVFLRSSSDFDCTQVIVFIKKP